MDLCNHNNPACSNIGEYIKGTFVCRNHKQAWIDANIRRQAECADKLDCSVALIMYIEELEQRITELEQRVRMLEWHSNPTIGI
jgi:hypothetical protein